MIRVRGYFDICLSNINQWLWKYSTPQHVWLHLNFHIEISIKNQPRVLLERHIFLPWYNIFNQLPVAPAPDFNTVFDLNKQTKNALKEISHNQKCLPLSFVYFRSPVLYLCYDFVKLIVSEFASSGIYLLPTVWFWYRLYIFLLS